MTKLDFFEKHEEEIVEHFGALIRDDEVYKMYKECITPHMFNGSNLNSEPFEDTKDNFYIVTNELWWFLRGMQKQSYHIQNYFLG